MADRINFFGLQDEKIYYDERKRRFFSNKDAPSYVMRSYKNSVFKEQRPYLYGQERAEFQMKLKYGQQLIRHMNY